MSKWTEGPWRVDKEFTIKAFKAGVTLRLWSSRKNADADANLIAAAPDLYDALQAMVDYCNAECGSKIYPGHQANEALEKARGEK